MIDFKGNVDYIFYTSELKCLGTLSLPEFQHLRLLSHGMPSKNWPSGKGYFRASEINSF